MGKQFPVSKHLFLLAVACCLLAAVSCRRVEREKSPSDEPGLASPQAQVITTPDGTEMVVVPADRFQMGTAGADNDESPAHEVAIDAFLMDRCEVTQAHWSALAGRNEFLSTDPSHFKGADLPVEMIRWDTAALWCNVRSRAEGLEPCYDEDTGECNFDANGYRLPTEAEWEYACRAGSEGDYCFGSDQRQLAEYAWYADNAAKKTHPVGQKKPNAWGLFDMHGNVAEWCNDRYGEDYYRASAGSPTSNPHGPAEGEQNVLRGGAWNSTAAACRSARRVGENPGVADACFARDAIGFRCVRKASEEGPVQHTTNYRPPARIGLVYDDVYLEHDTELVGGHPERPERLKAIMRRLKTSGLLDELVPIAARKASLEWVRTVHTPEYIQHVKESCEAGIDWLDTPDTPVSKRSYEVALTAAGGVLAAVDAVMEGRVQSAFCAVRPPGHHATADRALGFCLFGNVAIATRYLQKKHHVAKVLIVDWDVHHGNGTQAAFYDDPTVFYFSVHRFPFYPGTGAASEKGEGKGLGFTINVTLPGGSGDEDYQQVFKEIFLPAATEFDPDFVFISAGFDAHDNDPLGGMRVSTGQFAAMTRVVKGVAEKCSEGRIVSVLEGGYRVDDLADSVEAHLRALME